MWGPFERTKKDLIYFYECCRPIHKKNRAKRFEDLKIDHCMYWFRDKDMSDKYAEYKEESPIFERKILYADYVYHRFEKDFGFCEHESYCLYHKDEEDGKLREGTKKLGKALHSLCHGPLNLIQFRTIGLHLAYKKIDYNFIKGCKWNKDQDALKKYLIEENPITRECRFILRKEQFMQHYFEITNLRASLSEEIKKYEDLITSLNAWGGLFVSIMITIFISFWSQKIIGWEVFLPIFTLLGFLLTINIIWHIWASIKLNEAKDVVYICLGVDIDNPTATKTC